MAQVTRGDAMTPIENKQPGRARRAAGAAVLALAMLAPNAAPAAEEGGTPHGVVYLETNGNPVTDISVDHGKSLVVRPGFQVKRVSVGNPEIADVIVTSPSEINVVGKNVGETNVVLWD